MMRTERSRTGLTTLKRTLKVRGIDGLDGRIAAVRAVNEWRTALLNDLGGEEAVSTQKMALVDAAARTLLLLNHVDCYLLEQKSLVNKTKKCLWPVVRERQTLCDSLARLLSQIGLERQAKPVKSLSEYLADKEREAAAGEPEEQDQEPEECDPVHGPECE